MKLTTKSALLKFLKALPPVKLSPRRAAKIKDTSHLDTCRLPIRQYLTLVAGLKNVIDGTAKTAALLPHPRQRDTLGRLAKAVSRKGHLSQLCAAHVEIVVALFGGQLYLVDGNHRSLYWLDYDISDLPSHVNLIIKRFDNEAEFIDVYYQYDSKDSAETGRQKLYGYMSDAGYATKLQTSFVRDGLFLSSLKHLTGFSKGNEAAFMKAWEEEFLALDAVLLGNKGKFHNGIVAALLTLFRTEVHADVRAFVRHLQRIEMVRSDLTLDGIQMTATQRIVDNLCKSLQSAIGSGNENLIVVKMKLTLQSYQDFKSAMYAETALATPVKKSRARKAA
jgi:hypothetical protein